MTAVLDQARNGLPKGKGTNIYIYTYLVYKGIQERSGLQGFANRFIKEAKIDS